MPHLLLTILHWLLVTAYVAAPVVALGLGVVGTRRGVGMTRRWGRFLGAFVAGALLGSAVCVAHGLGAGGHVAFGELVLAGYFGTSLVLLLNGFDFAMAAALRGLGRLVRRRPDGNRAPWGTGAVALLVRGVALLVIGVPLVVAATVVYRPNVSAGEGLGPDAGLAGREVVAFDATDGTRLVGWWVPAFQTRPADRTVLLCHGTGETKATHAGMARLLVRSGYNVLAFDFRGAGDSAGHVAGFGDVERRDVLGAVRWLRSARPGQARHVYGVGVGTGAAALVAAAADPGEDGAAIEAVALYGAFDSFPLLARDVAGESFAPGVARAIVAVGLPIASVHVGTDLGRFHPADLIDRLWPRPVMVLHGGLDATVPVDRGDRLYRLAPHPKRRLFLDRADHFHLINNPHVADEVRRFFDEAVAVPVI